MPCCLAGPVHYQAWAAETQEEVENTREDKEPAQIIVAQGTRPQQSKQALWRQSHTSTAADKRERAGLGVALLTMRPGERALVRVAAPGAYGAGGSFSFPAVAPHTALLYDVHLLAVQRAQDETPVKVRPRYNVACD